MADCSMYGLSASGHHLTNVILHALCVIVLLELLFHLGLGLWPSFFISALFAFHPVNVEAVGWISQRKTILCMLFMLSSMGAYVAYVKNHRSAPYLISLFLYTLSVGSKPMAVSMPLLLIILDWWPLGGFANFIKKGPERTLVRFRLLYDKLPYALIAACGALLTIGAQHSKNAIQSMMQLPLWLRLQNSVESLFLYIGKVVWPGGYSAYYPFPVSFNPIEVSVACCAFMLITVLAVLTMRRYPWFFTGWFWFVISLLPMIGLVQAGEQAMADRYAYLPIIGLLIITVAGLHSFLIGKLSRAGAALAVVIALLLALETRYQQRFWTNETTLFTHALDITGPSALVHNNLGWAYLDRGDCSNACFHLEKTVALKPGNTTALNGLAYAYIRCGRVDIAEQIVRRALSIDPEYIPALKNQAWLLMQAESSDRAIDVYRHILRNDPLDREALLNTGLLLKRRKHDYDAIAVFGRILKMWPGEHLARYNRAVLYFENNKNDSSLNDLEILKRDLPGDTSVLNLILKIRDAAK